MNDSLERDEQLEKCDQRFYKAQSDIAKRLYTFIKRNVDYINFGNPTKPPR
jgi:hypothetical protein